MPDITSSLEYGRILRKQEKAREESDIWAAILALGDALAAAGITVPEIHIQKAQEALLRADVIEAGDLPDATLAAVATVGSARIWKPTMGQIFKNEPIIAEDGSTYICRQPHLAQAGWAPGTEGGRTLFRLIRSEPETGYLDFAWGEHVPFGSVRRDPTDDKLYTPIHPEGVTLYEPHYPNLVPSQYTEYTPEGGGEQGGGEEPEPAAHPKWSEVPDGYTFEPGTYFTDYSKTYHVLRQFTKQANWRPPALNGDFYEEATA
ncbi:MAG: hypothetical protein BWY85_00233 [Firmicutes bacterium ADurb.Bin506]|nr:MAG: hypothetical protein BWY85_00233 [Firmicutes bacterium ADurb.Bin506]